MDSTHLENVSSAIFLVMKKKKKKNSRLATKNYFIR